MSQYGGGGGLFGSPLRRQDTSGQVAALQQRCSHLEIERDKLADQRRCCLRKVAPRYRMN